MGHLLLENCIIPLSVIRPSTTSDSSLSRFSGNSSPCSILNGHSGRTIVLEGLLELEADVQEVDRLCPKIVDKSRGRRYVFGINPQRLFKDRGNLGLNLITTDRHALAPMWRLNRLNSTDSKTNPPFDGAPTKITTAGQTAL